MLARVRVSVRACCACMVGDDAWQLTMAFVRVDTVALWAIQGAFLSDLAFLDDAMPQYVGPHWINFDKNQRVYNVIRVLQQYQLVGYSFPRAPAIVDALVNNTHLLEDGALMKLSFVREPRGSAT